MKNTWIVLLIFVGILVALYFLIYKPDIDNAFQSGIKKVQKDTDTTYLPGKPIYIKHDSLIYIEKQVSVIDSAGIKLVNFDSTLVDQKDTISIHGRVQIKDSTANVRLNIRHVSFRTFQIDTIHQTTPKYVTETVKVTIWPLLLILYLGGILTALAIFLLGKG